MQLECHDGLIIKVITAQLQMMRFEHNVILYNLSIVAVRFHLIDQSLCPKNLIMITPTHLNHTQRLQTRETHEITF